MRKISNVYKYMLAGFAFIGVIFTLVFLGMQTGVFNVRGSIADRNKFFTAAGAFDGTNYKTNSELAIQKISSAVDKSLGKARQEAFPSIDFSWTESPEWITLKTALTKDRTVINKAAHDVGVSPRVLVSVIIAEQLRFFTSDRESFKKFFEPLKILGTLSQFSLGVSGIKPETALFVEQNLQNQNSEFSIPDPTGKISHILDISEAEIAEYGTNSPEQIRFNRLTDSHNHYYSYLYTALFVRQIGEQWKRAGYDISYRPEILATLFNLGFEKSVPKPDPKTAGSQITLSGKTYTFGELAFSFYYSGELALVFGY